MAVQWSDALRNAILDQITSTLGAGWKLKLRTGAQPANVAAASTGTVVATYVHGTTSGFTAGTASGASKNMIGSTISVAASAANAGGAMHYELTTSADVVHERGIVDVSPNTRDMTIDNLNITAGQTVNITAFTKTGPHP